MLRPLDGGLEHKTPCSNVMMMLLFLREWESLSGVGALEVGGGVATTFLRCCDSESQPEACIYLFIYLHSLARLCFPPVSDWQHFRFVEPFRRDVSLVTEGSNTEQTLESSPEGWSGKKRCTSRPGRLCNLRERWSDYERASYNLSFNPVAVDLWLSNSRTEEPALLAKDHSRRNHTTQMKSSVVNWPPDWQRLNLCPLAACCV